MDSTNSSAPRICIGRCDSSSSLAVDLAVRRGDAPRAERLRLALEELGPIFVKFGQALSTRRDLLPVDIADELAKLQDRVPPFDGKVARAVIEAAYGRAAEQVFSCSMKRRWPRPPSRRCTRRIARRGFVEWRQNP